MKIGMKKWYWRAFELVLCMKNMDPFCISKAYFFATCVKRFTHMLLFEMYTKYHIWYMTLGWNYFYNCCLALEGIILLKVMVKISWKKPCASIVQQLG
jgi:hypothetical protein